MVYSKVEKNMSLTKRKKGRKRKLATIPEGVLKLNKIVFYDDTDSGSWKFVV